MKPNNSLKFLKYLELMIRYIWSFQIFNIEDFFFKYPKLMGITKIKYPPHIGPYVHEKDGRRKVLITL
jgi:hypothetical protein